MDFTAFANEYIFPIFLLIVFLSTFVTKPITTTTNNNISPQATIKSESISYTSQLEQFYESVERDDNLIDRIEAISQSDRFSEEIVKLGNSLGYQFTTLEVENTTTYIDDNYICLPIGCWYRHSSNL